MYDPFEYIHIEQIVCFNQKNKTKIFFLSQLYIDLLINSYPWSYPDFVPYTNRWLSH